MTLRDQLTRDEGIRLAPYRDTVGKLTIGCGRNLDDKGITRDEALYLLENDIAEVTLQVSRAFPWAGFLNDARRGVLINMAFNMGIERLKTFKNMLAAMDIGDWPTAADELMDSKYAKQVGERAARLRTQLITGDFQ